MRIIKVPLVLALASCAPTLHGDVEDATDGVHPPTPGVDAPPDDDGLPATDAPPTAPGGDPTCDPADGTDQPTDAEPPVSEPLRFLVLGDGGRGTSEQYEVSAAMEQVCAANGGCAFALHTGDNIYSDGVSDVEDEQFQEKFELPYANLDFPFWLVLGNHDYGNGQEGVDAQVEYTDLSDKWNMPAQYYTHQVGDVTIFGLDTEQIDNGDGDGQVDWLTGALPAATTTWKLAFGHHPYLSNGDHGNADGDLASFVEDHLCGRVDVYFAGHDHDLQWLEPTCGTEFIVSGAASDLRDVGGDNPTLFEDAVNGFLWVEIVDRTFTGVFYDVDGNELFRRVVQK